MFQQEFEVTTPYAPDGDTDVLGDKLNDSEALGD